MVEDRGGDGAARGGDVRLGRAGEREPAGGRARDAFKVDGRLTSSLYMGERWASPARYSKAGDRKGLAVEARAHGRDARGNPVPLRATWTSADPKIVTPSAGQGHEVTLRVRRAGRTELTVVHGASTRTLAVEVVERRGVLQVTLARVAPAAPLEGGGAGVRAAAPSAPGGKGE